MKIRSGKLEQPVRDCIYGEPGVGKTTFAAGAPSPLFICVEQGTANLDVARARVPDDTSSVGDRDPRTFDEVVSLLDDVATEPKFKTVVIDTLDGLETMIHAHVCKTGGKRSISEFGYGKGEVIALDSFRIVLGRLERCMKSGTGIVLVAHGKINTYANPEGQDFNYHDLKLHKLAAGLIIEWCDNVLFARREQFALEENGKVRGVGTAARFIHTIRTPAFVAKNRFGLPDRIPLSWADYESARKGTTSTKDKEELVAEARVLVASLPVVTREKAMAALAQLPNTVTDLRKFIDYTNAKLQESTK